MEAIRTSVSRRVFMGLVRQDEIVGPEAAVEELEETC